MTNVADTIVAPATPPAPAARAIVRTSGPAAFALLASLSDGGRPPHASATTRSVRLADGIAVPTAIYAFVGPRSSTGDDVVEYHLPGSPLFVRLLLGRLLASGARMAEPGEFTARAFFAGRIDLAQAEGVAATIAAAGRGELDAARQLSAGELSRCVAPIVERLVVLLAGIEATLDFADEPIDAADDAVTFAELDAIDAAIAALLADAARIGRVAHEPRVVLTGRPNAGKSTLFNALVGSARAVESDVAGTTRDAISAPLRLRRGTVTLVDTAGLEDAADADPIGRSMRDAATGERQRADVVVAVVAADDDGGSSDRDPSSPQVVVITKSDLRPGTEDARAVCARSGDGLNTLRDRLDVAAFGTSGGGAVSLNARHLSGLRAAQLALRSADAVRRVGPEFTAAALRASLDGLRSIGGSVTPDDILGRIFGSFCIGK